MTTHPPRERRSQAQRSAETRTRLLEATIGCLVQYGYAGTTTPRVAEMAGLTRGAQVHHFGSRDDLMLAAIQHLAATRTAMMVPEYGLRMARAEDPLDAIFDIAWDIHCESMFIPVVELWVAARTDPALRSEVAKVEATVVGALLVAVAEYVPADVKKPMLQFLYTVMDTLRGVLISSFVDDDASRARRRWERSKAGLRRAADPSIARWAANRPKVN
ncbi:TetR/AcrR family transcriptional regulator [Mycolicibacterium komossense]|uniref:TetR/AcrR family transcriptional regulator n=1 Tax=Mycolicibacterium komossense TaxID=1779 RepID=A0ABT3CL91_9MYCO|nr:TetR/AcrR family transcriptional regulator [Mycolicibacterium komossense]MCV7230103.1 TetR/AcrR family transcriptional regulator [Mycolicibacterium komossense]